MSLIDTLKNDWDHLMAEHGPELEHALTVAAAVADSPAAQMILSLAHVPVSSIEAFASAMQKLDADFAKMIPPDPTMLTPAPAEPAEVTEPDPTNALAAPSGPGDVPAADGSSAPGAANATSGNASLDPVPDTATGSPDPAAALAAAQAATQAAQGVNGQ
jgi:hypothetical protein